jgi:arylsulfatase A-like enzyme
VAIFGAAWLIELGARVIVPIPFTRSAAESALSLLPYVIAALPALAAAGLGFTRLAAWLAAAPFAVTGASLAFADVGAHPRWVLSLAALAGAAAGLPLVRRPIALAAASGLAALLLLGHLLPGRGSPPPGAANVLLIVLDTTGARHLSTYGYPRPTTPHLTALAARGRLYERALANAPWTVPSHAALFTGRYPSELGFDGGDFAAPCPGGTIAADMVASGRAAYGISANLLLTTHPLLEDGFDRLWTASQLGRSLPLEAALRERRRWQTRGDMVTALAVDWLDRVAPRGRPWFLFLNYLDAHAPYDPRDAERSRFAPSVPAALATDSPDYNTARTPLTAEVRRELGDLYDAELAGQDDALGNLLAALAARGYDDSNLLIVVTADHGEALGEHGFVGHMVGLTDSVLHVPLVIVGLGTPPDRITTPVGLVQLRATLRALLRLEPDPTLPAALPPWGRPPSMLVAEHLEPTWYLDGWIGSAGPAQWRGDWTAIERDGVKVVFARDGRGASYDLRTDPDEKDPRPLAAAGELVSVYESRWQRPRTEHRS